MRTENSVFSHSDPSASVLPQSGAVKSTLPGPREGSSILNVDLVVVTAAVCFVGYLDLASGRHNAKPETRQFVDKSVSRRPALKLFVDDGTYSWDRLRLIKASRSQPTVGSHE